MSGGEKRCCIPTCENHAPANGAADASATPCSFFPVPVIGADDGVTTDIGLRRALWLRRIRKCTLDFDPDTALLCSRHFIEGKPAELEETGKLDWLPNTELDEPDDLVEDVEDFILGDDDEDEDEEDEEFILFNKKQKEKLERLKRENVALKRKIQEIGQGGIIQGMRLKMLKSMKVDSDKQSEDEEDKTNEEAVVKVEPIEEVDIKIEPREEEPAEEKPPQPKLQINSLKMKLSNILGTIK